LEQEEAIAAEKQAHAAYPEAPMTNEEKQQIVQSLIDSFKNSGTINYNNLIKDIEKKCPCPVSPPRFEAEPTNVGNKETMPPCSATQHQ
jgi:hypothetical protein